MEFKLYKESADYIKSQISIPPKIGVILGSGLGFFDEYVDDAITIPYSQIPNFGSSEIIGHANRLVIGKIDGKDVVLMSGRFHYYEGNSMEKIAFPIRVLKLLGVETLIITNAAGGVNTEFSPGDLMLISDHIKLTADSPLRGKNDDEFGERFNDLSNLYTKSLREKAKKLFPSFKEGVYTFMGGPSFETPAEIRAIRVLGGDAVGMSTVPEAITAGHCGMKVLGISCITNMASGILPQPLSHKEVIEVTKKVANDFANCVKEIIKEI